MGYGPCLSMGLTRAYVQAKKADIKRYSPEPNHHQAFLRNDIP
jgi:hypothetical protein